MAVYTDVSFEELEIFLAAYDLGEPHVFKGIAEGVSNSNYYLQTEKGAFILTLYEMRVEAADLPFYLGLMEHLARAAIRCPTPVHARNGAVSGMLNARPAAILTFLDGVSLRHPTAEHCRLAGRALAELHEAGASFKHSRTNALGPEGWRKLAADCAKEADSLADGMRALIEEELANLEAAWPASLPQGVIHADLFPDNVLFVNDSGFGHHRFLFRLQRCARLRSGGDAERVVFRARWRLQPHQGARADRRLPGQARPGARRKGGASPALPRRGASIPR